MDEAKRLQNKIIYNQIIKIKNELNLLNDFYIDVIIEMNKSFQVDKKGYRVEKVKSLKQNNINLINEIDNKILLFLKNNM